MQQFISIYNHAPSFSLEGMTLREQYETLCIAYIQGVSSSKVEEELVKRIHENLTSISSDDYMFRYELKNLQDAYWYSVNLDGKKQYKEYYIAIHELLSLIGADVKKFVPLSNVDRWVEAMKYLKCYQEIHGIPNDYMLEIGNEKLRCIVGAVRRLQKKGVRHTINTDNKLEFSNVHPVLYEIESMMEGIGGVRFVNACLSRIEFDTKKGRLMFPKQGNRVDYSKFDPEIPWGYLFNLAFRKTNCKGSESAIGKNWKLIIQEATDLCLVMHPVHNFNAWMAIFDDNPESVLRKWIVYYSLMDVQQSSWAFCIDLMDFLIDRLIGEGKNINRCYNLADFKSLMHQIGTLTKDQEFVRVKISDLQDFRSAEIKEALLRDISNSIVNPNYMSPLEIEKINYVDKPTIGLSNGDLLLYPSSIGSMGWYEVMMTMLRERDGDIDNFVGLILEEYVKGKLASKGISTKCGKYCVNKTNGECDIVVENNEKVLLFEMKKKNLTRKARSGYLYQIILDFAGSIVSSQEQAHRTEALVKKNGSISLLDGKDVYTLDNNNRSFEKITVTLNEYGPLHERVIQQKILEIFYRYRFNIDENEIRSFEKDEERANRVVKGYKSLVKKQNELLKYIEELANYDKRGNYNPFFDSWFFSIEQLCYLIDSSKGCDDFIKRMTNLKYVSFFTKDFWSDVDLKLRMHDDEDI